NMADWGAALREMSRVLASGGHVLILDFSIPAGALRPAYRFYLHNLLPTVAGVVTGQQNAYTYLAASIEEFPSGNAMVNLINANAFADAHAIPLTGGIATIYTATKAAR
ncbi:MAG: class I SAM-dependent methyltransferase, partial [Verrucomicrobiota bacterium]|nr:class I SAM-dependent methyltransferase [Verrucomicrobiota bacterium]